jgi:hypothetical protein
MHQTGCITKILRHIYSVINPKKTVISMFFFSRFFHLKLKSVYFVLVKDSKTQKFNAAGKTVFKKT